MGQENAFHKLLAPDSTSTLAKLKIEQSLGGSPFAKRIPGILKEAHEMLFEKPAQRLSQS